MGKDRGKKINEVYPLGIHQARTQQGEKVHGFVWEINSQGMDLGIWFCKLSTSEEINVGNSVCI